MAQKSSAPNIKSGDQWNKYLRKHMNFLQTAKEIDEQIALVSGTFSFNSIK